MTEAQRRQRAAAYEQTLETLNAKAAELEKDMEELEALAGKFSGLQDRLALRKSERMAVLGTIGGICHVKSARVYHQGMSELAGGPDYGAVYGGLSDAIDKIYQEISSIRQQLSSCEYEIGCCKAGLKSLTQ